MEIGPEGHRKRLRERFESSGFEGFHDHEVLELILSYAIPRRDVKTLAKMLLAEYEHLSAVLDAPLTVLKKTNGIGDYAATLLAMIPRLVDRYQQDRCKSTRSFNSTGDAVRYLSSLLSTQRNEAFYILALNSRNVLIAHESIQKGSVNRTAVSPRLVVEACLKHRATAVIFSHNHPGGDPKPSMADKHLTRKLKNLLNDLDIIVHDHIIIAGPNYYSFSENGVLNE